MNKYLFILFVFFAVSGVTAQNSSGSGNTNQSSIQRPKLVIGIVVDQMRWDYLYRYYNRYTPDGGFKRLLNNGFSCENTLIPYTPTLTACVHTCIYTGSVHSIHGITGNDWWDYDLKKYSYCTEDENVNNWQHYHPGTNESPQFISYYNRR